MTEYSYVEYVKKKTDKPIDKCAIDLNRHFTKEDIPVANKPMKWSLNSLVTRKKQIKSTMRYYHTATRRAEIKR